MRHLKLVAKKWSPSIVVIMSPLHGEGRMFDPCGDQLQFVFLIFFVEIVFGWWFKMSAVMIFWRIA